MKIYIYTLSHPISNEVRYVGKTINIKRRYDSHLREGGKLNCHSSKWIGKLQKQNLVPSINVIEDCTEENWIERETYWISYYSNLTNHLPGGEGAVKSGKYQIKFDSSLDIEIVISKAVKLIKKLSDRDVERKLGLSKGFLCRARTGRIKYINELGIKIPKSSCPKGNGGATKGVKLKLSKPRRKEKTLTYMKDRGKWRIYHYVDDKRKIFGMYNTKKEALSKM